MNSSFSQVTDVIEYKSLYRIDGKRELILWPVWAYRVVAPKIVNQNINVLQKVVLGMCRVGETQIKKMDDIIFSYPERERIINMLLVYLEKAILHNRYNGHAYYLKAWLYKELLECIYDEDEEKEYLRKGRSAKKSAKKYLAKERNYPKFEKKQRYYSGIPGR